MKLIPESQCDKSLASSLKTFWPKQVPGVSINGLVLIGFEQELFFDHQSSTQDIELAAQEISELYQSLYPQPTFVELAILAKKRKPWFPFERICSDFHFNWTPTEQALSEILVSAPQTFQNWCFERKVFQGDLKPLLLLKDPQIFFSAFSDFSFSKSDGCQVIELSVDLILRDEKFLVHLKSLFEKPSDLLPALRKLKNPLSAKQDEIWDQKLSLIPNSSLQKIRWLRQGDQKGLEIRFFVSHPKDLSKHRQALQELETSLLDLKGTPWKIN